MGFAEAKKIRGESLSNRIASRLVGGESFGSSIGKSLSEGTKARMTGLKEKINPMNIAKFMTGGSNLAAALAGRMTGASKENMKYFTGKQGKMDTASKIKPIQENEGISELLNEIYLLLEDSRQARLRDMPTEEDIAERERKANDRHKALLDAINGKVIQGKKATASKVEDEQESSIFDNILGAFGLKDIAKSALSGLGRLATFAIGPIGAPLLAAASIGAFGYFIYKALKAEPSYEAEQEIKGIQQAQEVGGLAGVKDEEDRIRKLPEYERTMAELKSAEKTFWRDEDGNPQKGTDTQLKGYAERGPEAKRAVEDYKKERDAGKTSSPVTKESSTVPPAPVTMGSETGEAPTATAIPSVTAAPTTSVTTTGTPSATQTSSTTNTASPMELTPSSGAVAAVTSQNLEMNLPTERDIGSNDLVNKTITNNTINSQNRVQQTQEVTMPSVRNSEETFKRMILYSTRVV